jgi:glycosyltransferase involved in cell wall biosynthesis
VPAICGDVDVWHLHDLTALAGVLPAVRTTTPVVYDAHELFLESGTAANMPGVIRRLLRGYERRLVRRVSAAVTVNDEIAVELQRRYGPRRIVVVHNCPGRWMPPPARPTLIREAAGIPPESPVVLYHGVLGAHRGIEVLMGALLHPGLESVHLVLLGPGVTRSAYLELARQPRWGGRVHVLDAVPPSELLSWVASADVGAMPIQRSTLNHFLATPNKLFECLAAGVPVVVSDFPAMRRITLADNDRSLGAICDPESVNSVAGALLSLLQRSDVDVEAMRERCLSAARERWNWEVEFAKLLSLYRDLAPRGGAKL